MKSLLTTSLIAASALPACAAILHFDLGSLTIPNTIEGIYINILTGDTAASEPVSFNSAPWVNLFLGATGIANSEVLRPWASSASYDPDNHYFINLAPNTVIDSSGLFVPGETVSVLHLGSDSDQFQSGVTGYLAFEYDIDGGGVGYGWLSFAPNDSGEGFSFDLVYSDTPGEAVVVGMIPEPASFAALAGLAGLAFAAARRRV